MDGDTYCVLCGVTFGEKLVTSYARCGAFKLQYMQRYSDERLEYQGRDCQYDCGVVEQEHTAWTEVVKVLGINERAPGIRKVFLSGEGYYDIDGFMVEHGGDRNQPFDTDWFPLCLMPGERPVFPFHPQCYELLLRCAGGPNKIQLDQLYEVLVNEFYYHRVREDFAYGLPRPKHGEGWRCLPGEEFVVVDPMSITNLDPLFSQVLAQIQHRALRFVDVGDRVKRDPFASLPVEVLHEIVNHIPIHSIPALMRASWSINASFASPMFWKTQIRTQLPWFWELHDFVTTGLRSSMESKQLYLWAMAASRPRRWMTGALMAIANRRRIWDTCSQILKFYHCRLNRTEIHSQNELLCNMVNQAEILQVPYISYFEDHNEAERVTSFWLHDHKELGDDLFTLETYWEQNSLVGISITVSGQKRPLGRCTPDGGATDIETLVLSGDDWIQGFVLYMQEPCLVGDDTYSCIEGIDLISRSGNSTSLGVVTGGFSAVCQRPLYVSDGRHLIGLTAEILHNRISRLGLIQCSFPLLDQIVMNSEVSDSDVVLPPPPATRQCMWRTTLQDDLGNKLWNLDNLTYTELTEEGMTYESTIPDDLAPRHPLLFSSADTLGSVTKLWALSAYVDCSPHNSSPRKGNWLLAGMCVERLINGEPIINYAGYDANMGPYSASTPSSDSSIEDEDRTLTQCFDIDGPGGERITEVAVCRVYANIRLVRLRTNKDREVIFGDPELPPIRWHNLTIPVGESIIGISLAFGMIGWDPDLVSHLNKSKRLISRIGILTMKNS